MQILNNSNNSTGPSCSKHRELNMLVSGENVIGSSMYNIKFTGIFAANAKATHIFSAKKLAYMPYLMIKDLMIR